MSKPRRTDPEARPGIERGVPATDNISSNILAALRGALKSRRTPGIGVPKVHEAVLSKYMSFGFMIGKDVAVGFNITVRDFKDMGPRAKALVGIGQFATRETVRHDPKKQRSYVMSLLNRGLPKNQQIRAEGYNELIGGLSKEGLLTSDDKGVMSLTPDAAPELAATLPEGIREDVFTSLVAAEADHAATASEYHFSPPVAS